MKIVTKLIAGLCVLFSANLLAQAQYEGIWQGTLEVAPGAKMTVQFKISREDDGSWAALINSPDQGALKDMPASSVSVEGDAITLSFTDIQGEYKGTLANGAIDGEWTQAGQSFPLPVSPYQAPTMTAEDRAFLLGTWTGTLNYPGLPMPVVFHFEEDENDELVSTFDSPNVSRYGLPVVNVEFADGNVKFALGFAPISIDGTVAGADLEVTWHEGPQDYAVTLTKGEYVAPDTSLTLDDASQQMLLGTWTGTLNGLTVKFRFERDEAGDFFGFFDSVTQNVNGLIIKELTLEESQLDFSLQAPPAGFSGEVSETEIAGSWKQGGQSFALTVVRDTEAEGE